MLNGGKWDALASFHAFLMPDIRQRLLQTAKRCVVYGNGTIAGFTVRKRADRFWSANYKLIDRKSSNRSIVDDDEGSEKLINKKPGNTPVYIAGIIDTSDMSVVKPWVREYLRILWAAPFNGKIKNRTPNCIFCSKLIYQFLEERSNAMNNRLFKIMWSENRHDENKERHH